jgi:hypothetical protein
MRSDRRLNPICARLPSSPSADVRIVRAVDEADAATRRNWAPTDRPVRPSAGVHTGVHTGWKCDKVQEAGDERVRAVTADLISRARAGDGEAF